MNRSDLFSVRMRAASGTRHLSGAERLVPFPLIATVVGRFLDRALSKGISPDRVVLTIEPLAGHPVLEVRAIDLIDLPVSGVHACRDAASGILRSAGVKLQAVQQAFCLLDRGPALGGGVMRGAMIMDCLTGERLEPDRSRGIRAARFDWSDDAFLGICEELARLGLTHFRTREALAVASKIASAPGCVAELCWSDDPDYTAGYVASPLTGYMRLSSLKVPGTSSGGRTLFVDREQADIEKLKSYLELQPVIINAIGRCGAAETAVTVSR